MRSEAGAKLNKLLEFALMKIVELVKISKESMKLMSDFDIKTSDWRFLDLYEKYQEMKSRKEKFRYIIAILSEKYNISESSVKRIIKRFSNEVKM